MQKLFPLTEDEYNYIYWVVSSNEFIPDEARNVAFELITERELLLTNEFSMSGTGTGVMKDDESA